jgi:hypothetical protein
MPTTIRQNSLTIGDLIAGAFDCARTITSNERQAAELAAGIIARRFARAARPDLARRLRALVASKAGAVVDSRPHAHAA